MKTLNADMRRLYKSMDDMKRREETGDYKKRFKNRALNKFLENKLAVFGLIVFAIILIGCMFAPLFTRFDPLKIDLKSALQSPTATHWFGTDKLGRDIFARVLYGGRISIAVGFGSALGVTCLGVIIGSYSGYKGKWFDAIFLRVSEVFMAFPQIILTLLMVTIFGQSLRNLIIIFIATGWGSVYRMARSQMLSIREEEYVQALRAFGLSEWVIVYKHMLPNAIGPIMVNITLSTAMFILQEAALSFLGLGVPLEIATWGNILNVANDITVLQNNWWIWLPVGLIISLFVLSINFIGDGLRDATDSSLQG